MLQDVRYSWKGKDLYAKNLSNWDFLVIFLINKLTPFLMFITKYYPFSLLWQDRRYHYKFKDFTLADDFIIKIVRENNYWFKLLTIEKISNIINIIGLFIPPKKSNNSKNMINYFRERVKDKDIFINELEDGKVNIKIAINNIPNLK